MSDYQGNIVIKNPAVPGGPSPMGRAPGMWKLSEVAGFIRQGAWPDTNVDPYWAYNTLLLSTTSLGNANNNLFVDSSGVAAPINRIGNVTQGAFSPYGPYWSNYFDGSGDYLTAPSNAAFAFGTGDFTIEFWINVPDFANFRQHVSTRTSETTSYWSIDSKADGVFYFYTNTFVVTTAAQPANTWLHIAAVRSSGTLTLYVNGVSQGSASATNNFLESSLGIGAAPNGVQPMSGYLSNLRLVKGTAVYTGNFTPPVNPLVNITGTSILTCQSNSFRDASSNNFTITPNGDARVTDFSPFILYPSPITYNQSDITNWSGYFDGSGDYLSAPSNAAFAYGTGNFTVELWFFASSVSGAEIPIYKQHNSGAAAGDTVEIRIASSKIYGYIENTSFGGTTTLLPNTWYHVAYVRNGSTCTLYLNGVSEGSASNSLNFSTNPTTVRLGTNQVAANFFTGYISNARVVKGTAVYTGNFTPPTTNLTAVSGTSLLTLQNAAFTDNSTNNFVITPNGNTTVTGNSPFNTVGYWSNYFDGSGDYLSTPANAAFDFGTGDFTLECWVYRNDSTGTGLFESRGGSAGLLWYIDGTNQYARVYIQATAAHPTSTITVPTNQWVHLAVTRSSGVVYFWMNGQAAGSSSISTSIGSTATLRFGASNDAAQYNGYLSNMRVVKGTAVYTSAFTPSTTPLTAVSGTSLLTCQNGSFKDNSTNNFTLTRTGDVTVQSFDPFYTSTIASNGGSMYFDGSTDNLVAFSSPAMNFGAGDWTIQGWVNVSTRTTNYPVIISNNRGGFAVTPPGLAITVSNSDSASYNDKFIFAWGGGGFTSPSAGTNYLLVSSVTNAKNVWYHLAVVRNGTSVKMYRNGIEVASATVSSTAEFNWGYLNTLIGGGNWDGANSYFNGYIADLQVSSSALYTAAFTPPTAPAAVTPATTLRVNGTNAGIYDATTSNDMETFGNAQVSTAVSRFGGSSMYFDGNDDLLVAPSSPVQDFGTGDFTIEMWVNPSNFSGSGGANGLIVRRRTDTVGTGAWAVYLNGSGNLLFQDVQNGSVIFTSSSALTVNTWQHVAITRSGTTVRGFIDGVLVGSGTSSISYSSTWYLILGMYGTSGGSWPSGSRGSFFTGYMDEVRITRGIARYTSNFTPPTQAFPTY